MKHYKKAQVSIIDLFSALIIFIIMMIALILLWNQYSSRLNTKLQDEELYSAALRAADQLAYSPGLPTAWEENESSIKKLGLAKYPGIISRQKLLSLQYLDYNQIKALLNIKKYDFYFNMKLLGDVNEIMQQNNIRLAYLRIGAGPSACLQTELTKTFDCKNIKDLDSLYGNNDGTIDPEERITCELYTDSSNINFFWSNLNSYDIIFFEDPQFNSAEVSLFDPWLRQKDHIAFFTHSLLQNDGNAFNIKYIKSPSTKTMTITSNYYNYPDYYLKFDGDIFNRVSYKTGSNKGDYTQNDVANYLDIAAYSIPNADGMSRWFLDDGRAYYISDGCSCLLDISGICVDSGEDLSQRIVNAVEEIVYSIAPIPFYRVIESGVSPPEDATIANVRRYVIYENFQDEYNYSAAMDFTLWTKRK